MYPLLRPGSFVQIDTELRKFQALPWRTEYDRPIYFVELRDGYACSWCEIQDRELLLMPHPLSHCKIRRFVYGAEAEIVGRVTAVAMRLNDPVGNFRFDRSTSKAKLTFEIKRAALVGWVPTGTTTRKGSTACQARKKSAGFSRVERM